MFDNASDNIRLDKRNYGIDLLRLVSMFLIVVLHSLSRGALVGVSPFNIHLLSEKSKIKLLLHHNKLVFSAS